MSQLAEEWLSRSCKIFQNLFSSDAYATLLREAEQFLWAGSELDQVSFESVVSFSFYALELFFHHNYFPTKKKTCFIFNTGQGHDEEID